MYFGSPPLTFTFTTPCAKVITVKPAPSPLYTARIGYWILRPRSQIVLLSFFARRWTMKRGPNASIDATASSIQCITTPKPQVAGSDQLCRGVAKAEWNGDWNPCEASRRSTTTTYTIFCVPRDFDTNLQERWGSTFGPSTCTSPHIDSFTGMRWRSICHSSLFKSPNFSPVLLSEYCVENHQIHLF